MDLVLAGGAQNLENFADVIYGGTLRVRRVLFSGWLMGSLHSSVS